MDSEIKAFLDQKVGEYNRTQFIDDDPISIPHQFTEREDIEISGFLTATIAWGQRPTIIRNAGRLLEMMPGGPYNFLQSANDRDLSAFLTFVHRTFNGVDCVYFLKAIRQLYNCYGGIGQVIMDTYSESGDLFVALAKFRELFFELDPPQRTRKHVSDVTANASAKRLNMYLRWMIRRDHSGVDFGLWQEIPMSALYIPLDVHSGASARKLGLLTRKQNDWKAVVELTSRLRSFDADDPVKYDYALFGLGVYEKF